MTPSKPNANSSQETTWAKLRFRKFQIVLGWACLLKLWRPAWNAIKNSLKVTTISSAKVVSDSKNRFTLKGKLSWIWRKRRIVIFGFNANAANHLSIKTSSAHQETVPFSTEGLKRRRILRSCRTNWKCSTSGEHNKRAHKIKVLKNGIPKIAHLYVCHFVKIFWYFQVFIIKKIY